MMKGKQVLGKCLIRIDVVLSTRLERSEASIKKLIRDQRVANRNGDIIKNISDKIPLHDTVIVDKSHIPYIPLLYMYHKPVGVLSSMGDPYDRPNLGDIVDKQRFLKNTHPVGRLDCDTSGLLLFSSHGPLTNILLQPMSLIPKTYRAVVNGWVDFDNLRQKLAEGVHTANGIRTAVLQECSHTGCDEALQSVLTLSVTEGKHRMVRRILHNSGHSVVDLKRVSFGDVDLKDLEVGSSRVCSAHSQCWAMNLLARKKKLLKER